MKFKQPLLTAIETKEKVLPHVPISFCSPFLSNEAFSYIESLVDNIDKLELVSLDFFFDCGDIKKTIAKEIVEFISELKQEFQSNNFTNIDLSADTLHNLSQVDILELHLKERSYNALTKVNIKTIDKLLEQTKTSLQKIDAIGQTSVKDINQCLFNWLNEICIQQTKYINSISSPKESDFIVRLANLLSSFLPINSSFLAHCAQINHVENDLELDNQDYLSFLQRILATKEFQRVIKNFWENISKNYGAVSLIKINKLEESFNNFEIKQLFVIFINYCLDFGFVKLIDSEYVVKKNTFKEYLLSEKESKPSDRAVQFVCDKFDGKTLREVGEKYGLTNERVRQVIRNKLKSIPPVFEDCFSCIFSNFYIEKKDFYLIFPYLDNWAYEYLSIKYSKGKLPLNMKSISSYEGLWKSSITKYLNYKNYQSISSNITKVIYYTLKKNSENSFSIDELIKSIELEFKELVGSEKLKNIENIIRRFRILKNVVFDKDNKIRFCKVNADSLLNHIDFHRYENQIISSNLIFRDYAELMEELDIRDGYELYYVLKYSFSDIKSQIFIDFRRVPTVIIGNDSSEEKQAVELLEEIAPVSFSDFCKAYEDRFGIRSDVIIGNKSIIDAISPFYSCGMYHVELPLFDEYEGGLIKDFLSKKDLWLIDEVKSFFAETFPQLSLKLINKKSFSRIGFNVNKGYVFTKKYNSVSDYFESTIFNRDIIRSEEIGERVKFASVYFSLLNKKRESFDYIENSPGEYFSIQKINHQYKLDKKDLSLIQNICMPICDKILFFNGNSIWDELTSINESILKNLNNNRFLLTSILRQYQKFLTIRIGGNVVLYNPENFDETPTLATICKWFISNFNCNSINEVHRRIEEYFDCHLNKYKLASTIKNTKSLNKLMEYSINEYLNTIENSFDDIEELVDIFEENFL